MSEIEKKRLFRLGCAVLLLAAAAVGLLLLFLRRGSLVPCPFRALTGLSCPGCGNTRAAAALLRLRFAESLTYNYAYPAEYLYILRVFCGAGVRYVRTGRFSFLPKYPAIDYVFLALLLVWGVVRNILHI